MSQTNTKHMILQWILLLAFTTSTLLLFYIAFKETYYSIEWLSNKKDRRITKEHLVGHLLYLLFFWISQVWFFYWLFHHWWFNHWVFLHLLWEWLIYVLIFSNLSTLFLLHHIKQERLWKI